MIKWTNEPTECYIPDTKEGWESLKAHLMQEHGLEDSPETWTFVLSQLQGVKMPQLIVNIIDIVNFYKRWKISEVLQKEKTIYIEALQSKLEKAIKEAQEVAGEGATPSSDVPSGSQQPEGIVQTLPDAKEVVVHTP